MRFQRVFQKNSIKVASAIYYRIMLANAASMIFFFLLFEIFHTDIFHAKILYCQKKIYIKIRTKDVYFHFMKRHAFTCCTVTKNWTAIEKKRDGVIVALSLLFLYFKLGGFSRVDFDVTWEWQHNLRDTFWEGRGGG